MVAVNDFLKKKDIEPMDRQKDRFKTDRNYLKQKAIDFVTAVMEEMLSNYTEPVRKGVAKGDPIGLSRTKFGTAIMMILYPNVLTLKEIADLIKELDIKAITALAHNSYFQRANIEVFSKILVENDIYFE